MPPAVISPATDLDFMSGPVSFQACAGDAAGAQFLDAVAKRGGLLEVELAGRLAHLFFQLRQILVHLLRRNAVASSSGSSGTVT